MEQVRCSSANTPLYHSVKVVELRICRNILLLILLLLLFNIYHYVPQPDISLRLTQSADTVIFFLIKRV
jgi:hypothetical protein